jgi:hypothetical protein
MTLMPFDSGLSRRHILRILAGGAALAAGGPSLAGEARIGRLIGEAKAWPTIAQRIDFISRALRGTTYQGYTLIGGPRRAEKFVVRDDAFDCVTFCETVLAAAIAQDIGEFEQTLRTIRYHNGIVEWRERNHYFFEWGQHNIENKNCRAIVMDGAVELDKTVDSQNGLSKRRFAMRVIPSAVFLVHKAMLQSGDIVGFVTRRPNLDYFHVGFVAFGKDGELLLRHASQSRHRVLDESMDRFLAAYRVRYVTLLRPQEPAAAAVAAKKAG